MARTHYSKLPPVRGFSRVRDFGDGTRALKCDRCGYVIPSLGVGYHKQNNWKKCAELAAAGGTLPGDVDNRKQYAAPVAAPSLPAGHHAVFAYTEENVRVRTSPWTTYDEALRIWGRAVMVPHPNIRWYAVRPDDDADWRDAEYRAVA